MADDLLALVAAHYPRCTLSEGDWHTNGPGKTPMACGEPTVALASFACVHEHVARAAACMTCAAELQRAAGLLVCPQCEDGPEPHECLEKVRVEWFTGEVTDA
jgi:hypothetical protein